MCGIGRHTQECISCTAQAEREINIGTAPPLKCFIKLAVLTKYRTAHEESKVFEKQALRRVWQIRSYPVLHLYFLCAHLFRIQILP